MAFLSVFADFSCQDQYFSLFIVFDVFSAKYLKTTVTIISAVFLALYDLLVW